MFHCTENAVCTPDGEDTEPVFIKIPHPRTGDLRLVYPHQSSQLNFAICLLWLCKMFCLVNLSTAIKGWKFHVYIHVLVFTLKNTPCHIKSFG